MENSPHSAAFKRQFDNLSDHVVHAIDEQCSYANNGDKSSYDEVGIDILQLTVLLHVKKNVLTLPQYALLGDIYEHVINSNADYTPSDFRNHIKEHSEDEALQEIPTNVLDLLRNYDAEYKTNCASKYKEFLSGLLKKTLSIDKPDKEIFQEFENVWTETVEAERSEKSILLSESKMLIKEINKGLKDFNEPVMRVRDSHEELLEIESLRFAEYGIRAELRHYCIGAIFVDSVIDDGELDLLCDLGPTFMLNGSLGSRSKINSILHNMFEEQDEIDPSILPLIITLLDAYDNSFGTDYGDEARALYFRLVNTVFKSDGNVCETETAWLTKFTETLYPQGNTELIEHDYKKHGEAKKQNEGLVREATLDECLKELNELIGLEEVKQEIHQLLNLTKVQKMREEKGLPASGITKHFVFSGNIGTGKSTVARILANIYKTQGILNRGQLVEVDGNGMVANSPEQTTKRVKTIVESALSGVLLIDDAHSLAREDGQNSYGQEAIEALLKLIDEHKDNLVVILAGNPDKMEKFINSNLALEEKFNKHLKFEDYTNDELIKIFDLFCHRSSFVLTESAKDLIKKLLDDHYTVRAPGFGNEREVRNIFECVIGNQANRIVSIPEVTEELLCTISEDDIKPVLETLDNEKAKSRQLQSTSLKVRKKKKRV